jgi:hypothetical protein
MPNKPRAIVIASIASFLSACSETALAPAPDSPAEVRQEKPARVAFDFKKARLLQDGDLQVTVRLRCPAGFQALEEPFVIQQGELTGFGFPGGTCDGHWDRATVRVFLDDPEGPRFQRGPAVGRVQVSLEHVTTGELIVARFTEDLTIR